MSYYYSNVQNYNRGNRSINRWSCTDAGCVQNNFSGEYTNVDNCINSCPNNRIVSPYLYQVPPPYSPPFLPYQNPYMSMNTVYPQYVDTRNENFIVQDNPIIGYPSYSPYQQFYPPLYSYSYAPYYPQSLLFRCSNN